MQPAAHGWPNSTAHFSRQTEDAPGSAAKARTPSGLLGQSLKSHGGALLVAFCFDSKGLRMPVTGPCACSHLRAANSEGNHLPASEHDVLLKTELLAGGTLQRLAVPRHHKAWTQRTCSACGDRVGSPANKHTWYQPSSLTHQIGSSNTALECIPGKKYRRCLLCWLWWSERLSWFAFYFM